ncbi:DUF1858 domain-containing protein [Candidatus Woesearchaeota archaeon]|jgi:hybrid cluster-associated redox disulfide protein|nr:DUF1858 domain-containing protein [Candidatus Woesearchaeota archaeon]MBT3537344.1 DUF1858 domain-containing protein [Candidatus Woesearchaeota archaeon]MBT4697387.1 DUF1858 domain-containing protein [Candidatus Woesearchaeota archaeon]MBT4716690.1 DUF1858 domain-containing protein [Candidatus Woesearchaeota archaeon]MBT7106346.1 DUF1858 domain-containing protein [Candidatus Woesearchaeota archaeon]
MTEEITKDTIIGDAVSKHHVAAMVMMKYGLHCIGCHVAAHETIEQGCKGHGMDDEAIEEMIEEINKVITEESESK